MVERFQADYVKLPVLQIVAGTLFVMRQRASRFAVGLIPPVALSMSLTLMGSFVLGGSWAVAIVWSIVNLGPASIFAVVCHRIALLENEPIVPGVAEFLHICWRFILLALIVTLAMWLVSYGVTILLSPLPHSAFFPAMAIYVLFVTYLTARFCLVFPACAVRHELSFLDSWNLSKGNGLRLLLITALIPASVALVVQGISATLDSAVVMFFLNLVAFVIATFAIVLISLSYSHLVSDRP